MANSLASGRERRGQSQRRTCAPPPSMQVCRQRRCLTVARRRNPDAAEKNRCGSGVCFCPFSYLHPMELLLGQSLRHGHVYLGCCSCWLAQAKASGGNEAKEEEKEEMPKMGRRSHSEAVSENYYSSVFEVATRNRAEPRVSLIYANMYTCFVLLKGYSNLT